MGSSASSLAKPIAEIDGDELRAGIEEIQSGREEKLTCAYVLSALKESAKRDAEIVELKAKLATYEKKKTAAEMKSEGSSAEAARDAGCAAAEVYALCADFPFNDETNPKYDAAYNKLSILDMDGVAVVTETDFGILQVASWSPDIYAAPPAWTRAEDGWDIRNRKKARILEWRRQDDDDEDIENDEEEEEESSSRESPAEEAQPSDEEEEEEEED